MFILLMIRTDRREVSKWDDDNNLPTTAVGVVGYSSQAEGEAIGLSSVARQRNSSGAEGDTTLAREAEPTELVEDCDDDGGGE